ncbi:MAG: hypothetical protein U0793_26275 [Gemmataceae bacterium]
MFRKTRPRISRQLCGTPMRFRPCVEELEPRTLPSCVNVTVTIPRITVYRSPDTFDFGELYARIKIGDNPEHRTSVLTSSFNTFFTDWSFTAPVDPGAGNVDVKISLFDEDLVVDEIVDINPTSPRSSLTLSFNPATGQWSGDVNSPDNSGRGNGDGSGDAELVFDISRSFVPVTVTIPRVTVTRSPDFFGFGDLYAKIKIGDNSEHTTSTLTSSFNSFFPNWTATDFVNPTAGNVPVTIALFDADTFADDVVDINPASPKTSLVLSLDLLTGQWSGDVDSPANSGRGNGNGGGDAELVFDITSDVDSDGDGLLDRWERNGVDINNDGVVDLDLPALGADPLHKDLFIEVDSMVGRAPAPAAITQLVNAFAAAPQALVQNPDGRDGVALHIQVDETDIPRTRWPNNFSAFDAVKGVRFGTPAERGDSNSAEILAAKAKTFRYAIFADRYGALGSSGLAKGTGKDFFITLGGLRTPGGTPEEQAATFMHELGHSLGLGHGGPGDDDNWKPNYHSVMNYLWGFRNARFASSWLLDYSRLAFPDLNEADLDEVAGIGGHAGHRVDVGPLPPQTVNESGPVDWNSNGVIDPHDPRNPIQLDVNRIVADENFDGVVDARDNTPGQTLHGHEDWSALHYAVACVDDAGGPGAGIVEITYATFAEMNDILYFSDLSATTASDLTLRRNGNSLEIYDNRTSAVVASRPLDRTRLVQIFGAEETDDRVTIDFASGGFFSVPAGVEVDGRAGGADTLIVEANGAAVARSAGVVAVSGATPVYYSQIETVKVLHRLVVPVTNGVKDDGDWGYRQTGVWQSVLDPGGFSGDYRIATSDAPAKTASWQLQVPSGRVEIFTRWTPGSDRADNAPYTIFDGSANRGTVRLNQRLAPAEGAYNGFAWASLGTFDITSGVVTVQLSNFANGKVVADGVIVVAAPRPLLAAGETLVPTDQELTPEALTPLLSAAWARWGAAAAGQVTVQIADLPGAILGLAGDGTIWIDHNAAGHGWFIDPTPGDDLEFSPFPAGLHATQGEAMGRIDLLTVLAHELGHLLGLEDLDPSEHAVDLMAATLAPGVRRVPTAPAPSAPITATPRRSNVAAGSFGIPSTAVSTVAQTRSSLLQATDAAFADLGCLLLDDSEWTTLGLAWERQARRRRLRG